jgi:hypothetical protein
MISKKIPQNLTTLALFFHKNPLYALQGIFLSSSDKNLPKKKLISIISPKGVQSN